jgi:hypothetical protein
MLYLINKVLSNLIWMIDLRVAKWNSQKIRKQEDKIRRKRVYSRI